jgi:superfamily II DNA or RNA helicase
MNRDRLLREGCELIVRTMSLRPPQAEALRAMRDALLRLPTRLKDCSPEQRREFLTLREEWTHAFHPTFTFALATGVGKTRLAGAVIAFLWLTGEAQTFLILAPRRAVLRRFENAFDLRFREYIFVDPNLVPEPSIVRGDEIDGPRAFELDGDLLAQGPKIYLLSPQLIASSERFQRPVAFFGRSPAQVLAQRNDLVVIADEAHHIGRLSATQTTAWAGAVRALSPCLQLGLTATPRGEEGEHVIYEYPLRRALREGLYTKDVHICVRAFESSGLTDEDVDRAAIDYSLDRLDRKHAAAAAAAAGSDFPPVKPVCVFFARDIAHAEEVTSWLVDTGRVSEAEILLTHSDMSKSEEELERLLSIEQVDNPVRVVVNVMELTEGWDVTNVYVVTPLRAMATFQGALQAMGRGLRLPAGRRVNNPILDELDVVCFGRERLERIVSEATDWSGTDNAASSGIKVTASDQADPELVGVHVASVGAPRFKCANLRIAGRELNLVLSPEALHRVSAAIVTEVRLAAASTRLGYGRPKIARDRFARAAALRCIRALPQFLSDERHTGDIEDIVQNWMSDVRPGTGPIDFDPAEVGEEIAAALRRNVKLAAPEYEQRAGDLTVEFPSYVGHQEVMLAPGEPLPTITVASLPFYERDAFKKGQLYQGWVSDVSNTTHRWTKAGHEAYAFDSEPEAMTAVLLDRAQEVDWWVRNAPVRFEIETPVGGSYRPDFIVKYKEDTPISYLFLEPKADHRWTDPLSDERLKNRAALEWAERQRAIGHQISVGVALETDIRRSASWPELFARLHPRIS